MLKYLIANITINNIPDSIIKNGQEQFINKFLKNNISLVDFIFEEEKKEMVLTLLSTKELIMGLVLKILKSDYSSSKAKKNIVKIKSVSFYPLRMGKIDELNQFINEHLPQISKISQKGVIPLGYLATHDHPPFQSYYNKMDDEIFIKKVESDSTFISHGLEFVDKKEDVLYISSKPYPVVFYIKIAMDEADIIDKIFKKIKRYGKVNYIKKEGNSSPEEYSLLCTADIFSVPHDTATIAIKINDYLKIPFHKVMIYIYDVLEKNDCIPFDAEFGFPIPSEVIKIASEDLFYDKESPAELSKEIKKVFSLFRFDIDNIFGYPSMLLEKKYNITDILTQ